VSTPSHAVLPIPPPDLAARIGGTYEQYRVIGAGHREILEELLPEDWSFVGKTVLDFGCGTGRTLAAFAEKTGETEFWGCDIHEPSIEWAQQHLSPPFRFFACNETPPLDQPGVRFDLVYGMSVFTHITSQWSAWLVELHRVMRPGGVAIVSVLGPAMAPEIIGRDWDERIGMAVVDLHKHWQVGGPDVLLSEWWVREHWGRAFDIVRFTAAQAGHDYVVMRRREVTIDVGSLESVTDGDVREQQALAVNLELLCDQMAQFGEEKRSEAEALIAREQALGAECTRLQESLTTVETSRSWRLTAPLRKAAALVRR